MRFNSVKGESGKNVFCHHLLINLFEKLLRKGKGREKWFFFQCQQVSRLEKSDKEDNKKSMAISRNLLKHCLKIFAHDFKVFVYLRLCSIGIAFSFKLYFGFVCRLMISHNMRKPIQSSHNFNIFHLTLLWRTRVWRSWKWDGLGLETSM